MTREPGDPFGSSPAASAVGHAATVRASPWTLRAAVGLAGLGSVAGGAQILGVLRRSASLSVAVYLMVLIGGSALLARHRLDDGRRSRRPGYVRSRHLQRWAVVAAAVIVLACALTGFVASTEWAKG